MKYYIIAGEASGDLHASNLMKALKLEDTSAQFRFFGGDLMAQVGGELVKHYRDLAYMGFIPVLLNLRTILRNMASCKKDVVTWKPDVLILVDYPGFNLEIAHHIHSHTQIPVYYYISPKIWAWKEHRIKNIKRDVDALFAILPFEVPFFKKHNYPIHYVGNPCVDAVHTFLEENPADFKAFTTQNKLNSKPIIALLAGSRKQEIKDNLPQMIQAALPFAESHQLVLAAAPGVDLALYAPYLADVDNVRVVAGQTYALLQNASAALVTSGTATLETALFDVPQVVCYHMPLAKLMGWLRKRFLKVKYISLVNLIVDRELVRELVADTMTIQNIHFELKALLTDASARKQVRMGYDEMKRKLGAAGASSRAAQQMIELLRAKS
ncbi:MAG: lipid-A-disaccharide synthase [Phocaeicola sp.]